MLRSSLAAALTLCVATAAADDLNSKAPPIKSSVPQGAALAQFPDLVVSAMNPTSGFPTAFTISNNGGKPAANASLLKVQAKYVPPTSRDEIGSLSLLPGTGDSSQPPPSGGDYSPKPIDIGQFLQSATSQNSEAIARAKALCGNPYAPVTDAVNPLAPGESQTIGKTLLPALKLSALKLKAPSTTGGTFVKPGRIIEAKLVCVYDVVVTVDVTGKVGEGSGEANNVVTRRVTRELSLD